MFRKTAVLAVQALDMWTGLPVQKGKVKIFLERKGERRFALEKGGGLFVFINSDAKWMQGDGVFLRAEGSVYQRTSKELTFDNKNIWEYLWVMPGLRYSFPEPVCWFGRAGTGSDPERLLLAREQCDAAIQLAEDYRGGRMIRLFSSGTSVREGQELAAVKKGEISGRFRPCPQECLQVLGKGEISGQYELKAELKKSYPAGQTCFLPLYRLEKQEDGGFYFPVRKIAAERTRCILIRDEETEIWEI